MIDNVPPQLQRYNMQMTRLLGRLVQHWRQNPGFDELLLNTVTELRSFLKTDCAHICQLQANGRSQVLVESVREQPLPSLLNVPKRGDEVPTPVLELLRPTPVGLMVDVSARRIWQSASSNAEIDAPFEPMQVRSLDPAVAAEFAAMNVRSLLLVPIYNQETLWGMFVAYHPAPRAFSEVELETVRLAAEQFALMIAQQPQANATYVHQGTAIDRITRLLYLSTTSDLKAALELAVNAFQGLGGRLYLLPQKTNLTEQSIEEVPRLPGDASETALLYTYGTQPVTSAFAKYPLIEQSSIWENHFQAQNAVVWAIADLFQEWELQSLHPLFQPTSIRSILMVPLWQQQECLGYLSIFRAGGSQSNHNGSQIHAWSANEIELGQTLGMHFTAATQRSHSQIQLQILNARLERQLQQHAEAFQQMIERQQILLRGVTRIRQSLDIRAIFRATTQEICQVLQADRAAIYQFNADWSGQFVNDFELATGDWNGFEKLLVSPVWNDTHLQETRGGRYRYKETFAVDDIYAAGYSPCHVEILEQYKIRAYVIAPIFVGQQLWGLLSMYQHSSPRHWKASDVQFLSQIVEPLGVAIQQATLVQQIRQ